MPTTQDVISVPLLFISILMLPASRTVRPLLCPATNNRRDHHEITLQMRVVQLYTKLH